VRAVLFLHSTYSFTAASSHEYIYS
jgi:hypothetical protein